MVQRCASHWRHVTATRKLQGTSQQYHSKATTSSPNPTQCTVKRQPSATIPVTLMAPPAVNASPVRLTAARPAPRKPDFLLESLKREGLYFSPHKGAVPHTYTALPGKVVHTGAQDVGGQFLQGDQRVIENVTDSDAAMDSGRLQESILSQHTCQVPESDTQNVNSTLESEPRLVPVPSTQLTSTVTPSQQDVLLDNVEFLPTSDSEQSFALPPQKSSFQSRGKTEKTGIHVGFVESGVQTGKSLICLNEVETWQGKVELMPPMAFMVHKDGTPIVDAESEMPSAVKTFLQTDDIASSTNRPQQAATQRNHPHKSLYNGLDTQPDQLSMPQPNGLIQRGSDPYFLSPVDEMVHIRSQLAEFQKCKQQLK